MNKIFVGICTGLIIFLIIVGIKFYTMEQEYGNDGTTLRSLPEEARYCDYGGDCIKTIFKFAACSCFKAYNKKYVESNQNLFESDVYKLMAEGNYKSCSECIFTDISCVENKCESSSGWP